MNLRLIKVGTPRRGVLGRLGEASLPKKLAVAAACATLLTTTSHAQDWPQWRGPNRDAKVAGFHAPKTWPSQLSLKWKSTVGVSDATPALVGGRLYAFSRIGDEEVLQCLDASTGKELWRNGYECGPATGPAASHPGPRSSPTVADGKVITLGVKGMLSCGDADSGRVIWRRDDFKSWPLAFVAMSPVVVDGMCIAHLGRETNGAIIAYDLKTGAEKWRWSGDGPSYASPVVMKFGRTKLFITETAEKIVAIDVRDGTLAWSAPFPVKQFTSNSETPLVDGHTVIYGGANRSGAAVKFTKEQGAIVGKELWRSAENPPSFTTPVFKKGRLYGVSQTGKFYCRDASNGKTLWAQDVTGRKDGYGSVLDAGDVLLALTPNSQLIVFAPSDKQFTQLASIKVAEKETYAYPVVAGKRIFIQDQGSVALWMFE